jgi:hypothetical protein
MVCANRKMVHDVGKWWCMHAYHCTAEWLLGYYGILRYTISIGINNSYGPLQIMTSPSFRNYVTILDSDEEYSNVGSPDPPPSSPLTPPEQYVNR